MLLTIRLVVPPSSLLATEPSEFVAYHAVISSLANLSSVRSANTRSERFVLATWLFLSGWVLMSGFRNQVFEPGMAEI